MNCIIKLILIVYLFNISNAKLQINEDFSIYSTGTPVVVNGKVMPEYASIKNAKLGIQKGWAINGSEDQIAFRIGYNKNMAKHKIKFRLTGVSSNQKVVQQTLFWGLTGKKNEQIHLPNGIAWGFNSSHQTDIRAKVEFVCIDKGIAIVMIHVEFTEKYAPISLYVVKGCSWTPYDDLKGFPPRILGTVRQMQYKGQKTDELPQNDAPAPKAAATASDEDEEE